MGDQVSKGSLQARDSQKGHAREGEESGKVRARGERWARE